MDRLVTELKLTPAERTRKMTRREHSPTRLAEHSPNRLAETIRRKDPLGLLAETTRRGNLWRGLADSGRSPMGDAVIAEEIQPSCSPTVLAEQFADLRTQTD